ncbi:MAG TPA: site-specific integrase [Candidatus Methylomirabilis sp.]|nr:site-specific integrase [Candidatus Methylomirabilis sp.]
MENGYGKGRRGSRAIRQRPGRPGYYYRFIWNGRLYEKGGFASKREAWQAYYKKRAQLGASGRSSRGVVTFGDAIQKYLDEVVVKRVNEDYERYIFGKMKARWASKPLSTITASDVEEYQKVRYQEKGRGEKTVSGSTVNRDLAYLRAFFNWAENRGMIPQGSNPASARLVKRFREPDDRARAITREQFEKLFEILPERFHVWVHLLYHLGVRKRVIFALDWEDVDFERGLIYWNSKGKSGAIPMNETVRALLQSLGPKQEGRIYPWRTDRHLWRYWDRARKAIGAPRLRLHDLRATFASDLAERGHSVKTIQGLLGHSTAEMTLRYVVSGLREQQRAVNSLDNPEILKRLKKAKS